MFSQVSLGPKASLWNCRACGTDFVWHPGDTILRKPGNCGNCDALWPELEYLEGAKLWEE